MIELGVCELAKSGYSPARYGPDPAHDSNGPGIFRTSPSPTR